TRLSGDCASRGLLRIRNPKGGRARNAADRTADRSTPRDQHENGQTHWRNHSTTDARPRRRGDRVDGTDVPNGSVADIAKCSSHVCYGAISGLSITFGAMADCYSNGTIRRAIFTRLRLASFATRGPR